MVKFPITSEQPYDLGVAHHFRVNKNLERIRGASINWTHAMPTVDGFADLRDSLIPIVRYTEALWLAAPERTANPVLELWYPDASPHCIFIMNAIRNRIEARRRMGHVHPSFEVVMRKSTDLNGIDPGWTKLRPDQMTPHMQHAVTRFNRAYSQWQNGRRAAMPTPPGGRTTPQEHLLRVASAMWRLQAERIGHFALTMATSSTCTAINAALNIQNSLDPDVTRIPYPAIMTGYGEARVYGMSESYPVRRTAAAIRLCELSPALLGNVVPPFKPSSGV